MLEFQIKNLQITTIKSCNTCNMSWCSYNINQQFSELKLKNNIEFLVLH